MPPSQFDNHAAPQMLSDIDFAQHMLPQTIPTMTQLPFTMSQQGQKRNLSDMEYVENTVRMPQHTDPTFYGLTASLPMSTYVTQLSPPPPHTSNKKLKQATQNTQSSCMPMQRRPQASPSYTSRSVASSRPRTVYRSQPTPSRHGHGPNELYLSTSLQQQPASKKFMCSTASTNPYVSDRPPTWNWLNTLSASGTSMNVLDQHHRNLTFNWPSLDDESQTALQLQNMPHGSGQMQQTSTQSVIPESAMQAVPSPSAPEPFKVFHSLQAVTETRNNHFGHIGAQFEENRPTDGSLDPQGTVNSLSSQESSPPPQGEIQRNDLCTESAVVNPLSDLPDLSAFDVAMFAHLPNLDHGLGFDSDFGWDIGDDIIAPSNVGEPAQGPEKEILSRDVDNSILVDSSDESALLESLQPVISYLASSNQASHDIVGDGLTRYAMPASHGVSLQPTPPYSSTTTGNDFAFSVAETQPTRGRQSAIPELESHFVDKHVPANGTDQCNLLVKPAKSDSDASRKSPNTTSSVIIQTTVSSKPSAISSPTGRNLDQCSSRAVATTSGTISCKTSAVSNGTSASLQTSFELTHSLSPLLEDPDAGFSSQLTSPDPLREAQSGTGYAENPTNMRYHIQEWLDGPSAELGQPVAVKIKALSILDGKDIYGWQVV